MIDGLCGVRDVCEVCDAYDGEVVRSLEEEIRRVATRQNNNNKTRNTKENESLGFKQDESPFSNLSIISMLTHSVVQDIWLYTDSACR
jgi:hypothetical protein